MVLCLERRFTDSASKWTVRLTNPNAFPKEMLAKLQRCSDDKPASSPSVGDWQYWHFYILDYPSAASPNITDALFDCEYQLFSIVPPFGTGVQTPLPRGRYTCDPRSEWVSDGLEMRLVENKVDFKLTIQDTAFAISSVGRMVREMNLTTSFLFTQYYLPDGVVVEGFYNISGISTVATS